VLNWAAPRGTLLLHTQGDLNVANVARCVIAAPMVQIWSNDADELA